MPDSLWKSKPALGVPSRAPGVRTPSAPLLRATANTQFGSARTHMNKRTGEGVDRSFIVGTDEPTTAEKIAYGLDKQSMFFGNVFRVAKAGLSAAFDPNKDFEETLKLLVGKYDLQLEINELGHII